MESSSLRRGGALALLLVTLGVLVCVVSFFLYLGSQGQDRLNGFLEEGRLHIQNEKPELAAKAFIKAEAEFNAILAFYQKARGITGATFISRAELAELTISAAMLCCYDDFFHLKASPKWLELAEQNFSNLEKFGNPSNPGGSAEPQAKELGQNIATTREVSTLCKLFSERKYNETMKGLLAAEKNAIPSDQDFFISEIRLLIACGKALNQPAILQQARELLFFLSYEARIKSKKVDSLWGILSR